MRRYRNSPDNNIRRLERAYLADLTDLVAYEALLAARIRAGIPVDDPKTPTSSVEAYAILLRFRIREGTTTRSCVCMAAKLGHAAARVVAPDFDWLTSIDWSNYYSRAEAMRLVTNLRHNVLFACDCVERVLDIFNHQYPDDTRLMTAIEAARQWSMDPSLKNKKYVRRANAMIPTKFASRVLSNVVYAAEAVSYATEAVYFRGNTAAVDATFSVTRAVNNDPSEDLWQCRRLSEYLVGEVQLPLIKKIAKSVKSKLSS